MGIEGPFVMTLKKAIAFAGFVWLLFALSIGRAAPYFGAEMRLEQPDGSFVRVLAFGDEFHRRLESPSGFALVRDPATKWVEFALLARDGNRLVPSGIRYTGSDSETEAAAAGIERHVRIQESERRRIVAERREAVIGPSDPRGNATPTSAVGDITGLTLLVDFKDAPATHPMEDLEELMNGADFTLYGNYGSVRQYFHEMSGGNLNYRNIVTDYIRAGHSKDHYDDEHGISKSKALVKEALEHLEDEGFDFTELTIDSAGNIRVLTLLYAGSLTSGWMDGLWPHAGVMDEFESDGIRSHLYSVVPIGVHLGIQTICHESGHTLCGFKDLYDYELDSRGVGRYCMMGHANDFHTHPVPINGYYRWRCGWEEVVDITDSADGTIFSSSSNSRSVFSYRNPQNMNEAFFIESRYEDQRNAGLPGFGFLIWHVDEAKDHNTAEQMGQWEHYYLSLEQADGRFDLENDDNNGDKTDPFQRDYKDEFSSYTFPNARWWNGETSELHLGNMSGVEQTMMFTIGDAPLEKYSATGVVRGLLDTQSEVSFDGVFSGRVPVNPDGTFTVDDLVRGDYVFQAKSHYYYSAPVWISVPDEKVGLELEMMMPDIEVETCGIKLTVTDERPVASAEFTIHNPGPGVLTYATAIDTLAHDVVINEIYTTCDGVELWNRGPEVSIAGWGLVMTEGDGNKKTYTFPSGTVIPEGSFLMATDIPWNHYSRNRVFFGFELDWSCYEIGGDELDAAFSVALVDGLGDGVDFYKTFWSDAQPPLGTTWVGDGVMHTALNATRIRNDDNDSAMDWNATAESTFNGPGPEQTPMDTVDARNWLTVSKASGTVEPGESKTVTVTGKRWGLEEDSVLEKKIIVTHSVPSVGPPIEIDVQMKVFGTVDKAKDEDCGCSSVGARGEKSLLEGLFQVF